MLSYARHEKSKKITLGALARLQIALVRRCECRFVLLQVRGIFHLQAFIFFLELATVLRASMGHEGTALFFIGALQRLQFLSLIAVVLADRRLYDFFFFAYGLENVLVRMGVRHGENAL